MNKMEILALRGARSRIRSSREEPKPDWMSDELHQGKCEAYAEAEQEFKNLIEAAEEA